MFTKYNLNFYLICFHYQSFAVQSAMQSSEYYKVQKPNNIVQQNTTSTKARSMIHCSASCYPQNCNCFSFDKQLQTCDIGNCVVTNASTGTYQEFYISCISEAGFKIVTSGSVTACVWVSNTKVNYTTARNDCQAKSLHLYTLKTVEKLTILQNNYKIPLWVGLNDMDVEGTYRWEDENTVCDSSCIQQIIFESKPLDNRMDAEDCVHYYIPTWPVPNNILNDNKCSEKFYFICEKPFIKIP